MTFLPDWEIEERLKDLIDQHDQDDVFFVRDKKNKRLAQLQPSSYELRLGNEVYLAGDKKLTRLGKKRPDISIQPGDFAILLTYEKVKIPPDLMAFISIRKMYKDMGLINISGFHVDPGFSDNLTFSVYNAGPGEIILRYKDPIFIIFFAKLTPNGCNNPREQKTIKGQIPSGVMNKLTGKPISPFDLEHRVSLLENKMTYQWGIIVAATIAVIIALIKSIL
jgi:dCTP deaminase